MASIGFLNPRVYDRDAEDLDSTFDGDEKSLNTRRSTEMTRHSRDVLEEEEETERLIAGDKRRSSSGGMFSRHMFGRHALGPGESLAKSEEWAGHMRDEDNEEGELLWSMERGEGKEKENDSSSMESREVAEVGRSKGSSHAGLKVGSKGSGLWIVWTYSAMRSCWLFWTNFSSCAARTSSVAPSSMHP